MPKSSWRQVLRRLLGATVIAAVPALALGICAPRSWQSFASAAVSERVAAAPASLTLASPAVPRDDAALQLEAWTDTFTPTQAQTNAENAALVSQRNSFIAQRNARYKAVLARYEARYRGITLLHYLVLLQRNLTIENLNFVSFQRHERENFFRNGTLSTSTYTFVALR